MGRGKVVFGKRNKQGDEEQMYADQEPKQFREVNPQTLMRWFSYDFGDGVPSINKMLDLTPVSDEGHAIEMSESNRRVAEVVGIAPLLGLFATFLGPVMTAMTLGGLSHFKDDNPDIEMTADVTASVCSRMNQQMLFHMFVSLVAAGIELGAIAHTGNIEHA